MFETLDYTLPPERDEAKLDALAWHILDKRPKTLLGLANRARAEKHLCRYLWTVDFESLPPSDQGARVVTECAMMLSSRPCDRGEFRALLRSGAATLRQDARVIEDRRRLRVV